MPLSNYLRGIPEYNQPAALTAAAHSIYQQHMRLLRDAAHLKSPKEIASTLEEIKALKADAVEIYDLNILGGHAKFMIERVATLNLDSVLASLRFQARHPNKTLH